MTPPTATGRAAAPTGETRPGRPVEPVGRPPLRLVPPGRCTLPDPVAT